VEVGLGLVGMLIGGILLATVQDYKLDMHIEEDDSWAWRPGRKGASVVEIALGPDGFIGRF
jgi:hypothetical protein